MYICKKNEQYTTQQQLKQTTQYQSTKTNELKKTVFILTIINKNDSRNC